MKRITKIILSLMTVLCVAFYTVGANAQEMAGVGMRQPNMDNSMSVTVSVGDGIREKLFCRTARGRHHCLICTGLPYTGT